MNSSIDGHNIRRSGGVFVDKFPTGKEFFLLFSAPLMAMKILT